MTTPSSSQIPQITHTRILFCEGDTDAACLKRLLVLSPEWSPYNAPIDHYPEPLGGPNSTGFLAKHLSRSELSNPSLRTLRRPQKPTPAHAHVHASGMLLLTFALGGALRKVEGPNFVAKLLAQIRNTIFDRHAHRMTFSVGILIDSDEHGISEAVSRVTTDLKTLTSPSEEVRSWRDRLELQHNQWQPLSPAAVGIFVLHHPERETGTLEELMHDAVSPSLQPVMALSRHFYMYNSPSGARLLRGGNDTADEARLKKATFTAVGQFYEDNPGKPLDHLYQNHENPLFDNQQLVTHPGFEQLLRWLSATLFR